MKNSPFKSDNCKLLYEKEYDRFAELWLVPSECQTIKTSFGTSYVRISGLTSTKIIVLLQGAGTTSLIGSDLVHDLVISGYKVVAIDNIHEFGKSYYSSKILSTSDLVDWLDQTLIQIGITNEIDLIGHSFGAWLCAQYAIEHPSKIQRITLLAPFMTIYWPRIGVILRLLLCVIPIVFIRRQFCYWYYNNAWHGTSDTRNIVKRWAEEFNLGLKCFKVKKPAKMNIIKIEQLLKIQNKTGIILGMLDRGIKTPSIFKILKDNNFKGQIEIFKDAGHDLLFTHRKRIINLLKQS